MYSGTKPGMREGVGATGVKGEAADVVAVVEGDGSGALEGEHGVDVDNHGSGGAADVLFWILAAELGGLGEGEALRDVANERVVGAGLVGDDIDLDAAADEFGQHVGAVADEADAEGFTFGAGGFAELEGFVEAFGDAVAVAGSTRRSRCGCGLRRWPRPRASLRVTESGCAPPMPPTPPVTTNFPFNEPPKCFSASDAKV